jgi:SAM-dependent methyltransferase
MDVHDDARAQAFAGRLATILNESHLGLALSIGHRTGLFDAMARLPAKSSVEIASAAGLQERYVREWLGTMVCAGIVDHDGRAGTYRLPAEHARFLTREAQASRLTFATQYLAALGALEDVVIERFRQSGGIPAAAYDRLLALRAEEIALHLEETLLPCLRQLVPAAAAQLESGATVLDVFSGRGHLLDRLAATFPRSRFVGYDGSELAELQDTGGYDLVTAFHTIPEQADPARVLRSCWRALRPGGLFLCVDVAAASNLADNVDHPFGPLLYTRSMMWSVPLSLARDGAGLGCVWGQERARRMLIEAGFTAVASHPIARDPLHVLHVGGRADQVQNIGAAGLRPRKTRPASSHT